MLACIQYYWPKRSKRHFFPQLQWYLSNKKHADNGQVMNCFELLTFGAYWFFLNRKWSKEIGTLIGANLYIKKWIIYRCRANLEGVLGISIIDQRVKLALQPPHSSIRSHCTYSIVTVILSSNKKWTKEPGGFMRIWWLNFYKLI